MKEKEATPLLMKRDVAEGKVQTSFSRITSVRNPEMLMIALPSQIPPMEVIRTIFARRKLISLRLNAAQHCQSLPYGRPDTFSVYYGLGVHLTHDPESSGST